MENPIRRNTGMVCSKGVVALFSVASFICRLIEAGITPFSSLDE